MRGCCHKRAWCLLAALALLLAGSQASARFTGAQGQAGVQDEQKDFSFFYFVRQWPGSFCSTHRCPLLKHRDWYRFTIHGLWPNYEDDTWPEFCDKSLPFDEEAIEDLLPELEEVWPSYMDDSTSDNFWAHEWNKHGTCALSVMPSEHKYFKKVLKLNWRYSLENALKAAGINPSANKKFSTDDVKAAIRDMYGVDALIHCGQGQQLTEIWMCIDKDLKPTDCKPQAEHCREVVIPPIPGSSPQAWDEEGEGSWGDIPAGMHFGSHDDQDEDDQDEDASASSESESESDSESDSESESEDDESDSSESGSESEPALYSYSEDEEVEKMRTATASKATAGASTAASKAANAAAAGVAAGAAGPGGASGGPSGAVRDVIIAASGALMAVILMVTLAGAWSHHGSSSHADPEAGHQYEPASPTRSRPSRSRLFRGALWPEGSPSSPESKLDEATEPLLHA